MCSPPTSNRCWSCSRPTKSRSPESPVGLAAVASNHFRRNSGAHPCVSMHLIATRHRAVCHTEIMRLMSRERRYAMSMGNINATEE